MSISSMRIAGRAAAACLLGTLPVSAAVSDLAANGFTSRIEMHIGAAPAKVYAALIVPARWWSSSHTFSGNAANLHLEASSGGCWCETLPDGGSAAHLFVVYANPGKALRLRGALGPFQGLPVEGAMTWTLKPSGEGTDLTLVYAVGGYGRDGFEQLAQASDGVLSEQVARLKKFIETSSPESR